MKKRRARAFRQLTQLRHIVRTAANVKESKAAKINRMIALTLAFSRRCCERKLSDIDLLLQIALALLCREPLLPFHVKFGHKLVHTLLRGLLLRVQGAAASL